MGSVMFGRLWCFFFDHDWVEYHPVNAKNGGVVWYCSRAHCGKRVAG